MKNRILDTDFIQGPIIETFSPVINNFKITKDNETRVYSAHRYIDLIAECFYLVVDKTSDLNEKIRILYEAKFKIKDRIRENSLDKFKIDFSDIQNRIQDLIDLFEKTKSLNEEKTIKLNFTEQPRKTINWIEIFEKINIDDKPLVKANLDLYSSENQQNYFNITSFDLTIEILSEFKRNCYLLSTKSKVDFLESFTLPLLIMSNSENLIFNQTRFEAKCNYADFKTKYHRYLLTKLASDQGTANESDCEFIQGGIDSKLKEPHFKTTVHLNGNITIKCIQKKNGMIREYEVLEYFNILAQSFYIEIDKTDDLNKKLSILNRADLHINDLIRKHSLKSNKFEFNLITEKIASLIKFYEKELQYSTNSIQNNNINFKDTESKTKNNPYPEIFKNYLAFELFDTLNEIYKTSHTQLADYSFIYRKMAKDELLTISCKPEVFRAWLSSETINIVLDSKIKTLDRCETDDKERVYNLNYKEIKKIYKVAP